MTTEKHICKWVLIEDFVTSRIFFFVPYRTVKIKVFECKTCGWQREQEFTSE